MNEHNDFLDEIIAEDPGNRAMAHALHGWRSQVTESTATPDAGLERAFSRPMPQRDRGWWSRLVGRPAFAFAAGFVAVFLVGAGAFALVARSAPGTTVAASTSIPASVSDSSSPQSGEIVMPADFTEQTAYVGCILTELSSWFESGLAADEAPRIVDDCGVPPIPDLGPEAETFRAELQDWSRCVAAELQAMLPDLADLMHDGATELPGLDSACGDPPDPRDYGLELPSIDWGAIDPSQLQLGDLGDLDLSQLLADLEKLLSEAGVEDLQLRLQDLDLGELEKQLGDLDLGDLQERLDRLRLQLGDANLQDLLQSPPFGSDGFDVDAYRKYLEELGMPVDQIDRIPTVAADDPANAEMDSILQLLDKLLAGLTSRIEQTGT